MLLAIDRGNTKDKFVVFNGENIFCLSDEISSQCNTIMEKDNSFINRNSVLFSQLDFLFSNKAVSITDCVLSSVQDKTSDEELVRYISFHCQVFEVNVSITLPFKNMYTSNSLGADRIADVAGAEKLYGSNVLVIDAGTCITFDYLDSKRQYLGGSISPSFRLKYNSLNNFTARLPLITKLEYNELLADNTEDCIASGVVTGTIMEIRARIDEYEKKFSNVRIVLTGGDAEIIAKGLKQNISIEKNLLFWGLKNIYEINVHKSK